MEGYLSFLNTKIEFYNYTSEDDEDDFKKSLLYDWPLDNMSEFRVELIHMGDSTVDVYVHLQEEEIGSKMLCEDEDFNFVSVVTDLFDDYVNENIDDFKLKIKRE